MPRRASISVSAVLSATPVLANDDLRCELDGQQSRAVVKNTQSFRATCRFECTYRTDGNDHISKGAVRLNPGQQITQPAEAAARIRSVAKRDVPYGGCDDSGPVATCAPRHSLKH